MSDPRLFSADEGSFAEDLDLLAQLLAEEGLEAAQVEDALVPRAAGEPLELSFAQRRMWFLDRWEPNSPSYLIADAFRLQGELDVAALAAAFSTVVARHEVLRTRIGSEGGEPRPELSPALPLGLPWIDVAGLPAASAERELLALALREVHTPFDLAASPLLRVRLVRLGAASWALLVAMHHIAADGWSTAVMMREVQALYASRRAGRPSPLSPLPVQYADFAAWQRRHLAGGELERLLDFWRARLAGVPDLLEIPSDRPRPPVRSPRGRSVTAPLPPSVVEALESAARAAGTSRFMALSAVFGALLGRMAGVSDLVVGTPIANRTRPETEGLIGYFANTLPLRLDLSGEPSWSELLRRVRNVALEAFDHQDLPFERLVEALGLERTAAHTPLFQALVGLLEGADLSAFSFPGLSVSRIPIPRRTAKFDLSLVVEVEGGALVGAWEWSEDLFDPATLMRLARRFDRLALDLAARPEGRVSSASWLDPIERHQLLVEWTLAGRRAGAPAARLDRWFEETAALFPERPAASSGSRVWSYRELDRRSNAVARSLQAAGVGRGSRVGLMVARSLDLPLGIVAILKAGGAYVPLDPDYPADRLAFVAHDAGLGALLVGSALAERAALVPDGIPRVDLALSNDLWQGAPGDRLEEGPAGGGPDDPAYVIYTSGSTGRPKGVLVSHGNVARLLTETSDEFGFGPDDVWTLFHSFAFDFSVWELWGALLYGGRVVVVPYAVSRSPREFFELLLAERVTVLNQTPSAFRQLIAAEAELLAAGPLPPSFLRFVIFGGEALELRSLASWLDRHGDAAPRLINMYGITETTVHVTYRPIERADLARPASVIGRPISDLEILLLDPELQAVPLGVAGEICVGGAGLANGYLGRPELTAERFVPHPHPALPGARLYRAGDLARRRSDGDLEYLGRRDHQVKIRGFRIEPGEIEAALASEPDVREAIVVARTSGDGGARLVAYVVPAAGRAPTSSSLYRGLSARLPEHMIPASFVVLSELPLTPEGKVDRRALPAPGSLRAAEPGSAYAAPTRFAEEVLVAVWQQVLGIERVGIEDNFFALGGDSILSVRAAGLAAERGLAVSLHQIFEHRTIADLATAVAAGQEGAARAPVAPFDLVSSVDRGRLPEDVEDAYPLAELQAGMLYHMALAPEEAPYHNVNSWHLRGTVDPGALRAAVAATVRAHPILRTSFDLAGLSEPLQRVHRAASLPVPVLDLRGLSRQGQERAVDAAIVAEKRRSFDLSRPPQLRFFVHLRGADEFQFSLVENHAIIDGWSLFSTLAEIGERYLALRAAAPWTEPAPPAVGFRDFVALERDALASDASRGFWLGRLRDAPAAEIPRWPAPVSERPERRTDFVPVPIPRPVSAALAELARRLAVPQKSILLAAHLKALSLATGQVDLVTGLTHQGRPEGFGGERVRGLFLNTLPLRFRLAPGSWSDLVLASFAAEREVLPHRRFPMAALLRELGGRPLFETAFNFIHFHVVAGLLAGGATEVLARKSFEGTDLPFQSHFGLGLIDGALELELECDRSRLPGEQISRLVALYGAVLRAMAEAPESAHDGAPLLAPAELARLALWGAGEAAKPPGSFLPARIAAWAAETPEATAVVCGDRRLSFAELAALASALAVRLRAAGVEPETRVAVLLRRSPELVIALLAVLEAGGAFVPLDPAAPAERSKLILADSGAILVLTDAALAPGLADVSLPTLFVSPTDASPPQALPRPPRPLAPEQLAYVLFTSGSTGRPKGVAVSHGAFVHYLDWAIEEYGAHQGAGAPVHSSVAFDLTLTSLFAPLAAGRPVHLLADAPGVEALAEALALGAGFSLVKLTPAHLEALAERLEPAQAGAAHALVVGGEALLGAAVAFWREHAPTVRIVNEYGPTETVVGCAVYEIPAGPVAPGPVPIGRPIRGVRLSVVSPLFDALPAGVAGELLIGGGGVARGYLGRPELTAERFVPDPAGAEPGARVYRSGDLARYRPDGDLDFLARVDDQIKIRGHRIEPGEIEAALAAHPAIGSVAVAARPGASGPRLVAYFAAGGAEVPEPAALRAFLEPRLPEAMIPTAFVALPALPLSANGKVDRRALPEPAAAEAAVHRSRAPRTPFEEVVAAIWSEVLGREQVGAEDGFFALGGHSLLAMRIASRLRAAFGVELPLAAILEHGTVAALSAEVERALRGASTEAAPRLAPVPRDRPLPLSFAQQRLWFIDRFEPESAAYHLPTLLRLGGELSAPALAAALGEIVRRHEVLRTAFVARDGEPAQQALPSGRLGLSLIDLRALSPSVRAPNARRIARAEIRRRFDLGRGDLLRAALLHLGEATGGPSDGDEHWLVLAVHHIASDGGSAEILVREALALYEAFAAGRPSPLAPLPVQYADYAVWQRSWLRGEVLAAEVAYWRERLAGLPPQLELPTDRPRPALPAERSGMRTSDLAGRLPLELGSLANALGASRFMLLLAVFSAQLARISGQRDLAVGTPVSGRNRLEVEGLIGFFVNTLVLRADLGGGRGPTGRELLAATRATVLGAVLHQELPFERLVEELRPQRHLGRTPLFQVLFSHVASEPPPRLVPGVRIEPLGIETGAAKFDLTLTAEEGDGRLGLALEYRSDLFDPATAERFLGGYAALLSALVEAPDRPVLALESLGVGERHQVTVEWAKGAPRPGDRGLGELFAESVLRNPDRVALEAEGMALSYGAASRRVAHFAGRIAALAAAPEAPVGLLLERSAELWLAVLAVLQAGGSYVPLDPELPAERLRGIAADAGLAALVVGQSTVELGQEIAPATPLLSVADGLGAEGASARPDRLARGAHLAYALYTSGSTGRPNGVLVSHGAAANHMLWLADSFGLDGSDRVAQKTPFGFDASIWEAFAAWAVGATVVVARPGAHRDPGMLVDWIAERDVTVLQMVPSMLAALFARHDVRRCRSLAKVFAGGEAFPAALPGEIHRALSERVLVVNLYGPTEAAIDAAARPCRPQERLRGGASPLGRPIDGVELLVLGADLEAVPIGVAGELAIAGAALARGYLGRPDLTAVRFVPHPRPARPGERLLLTRDRARWLPGGEVEFLGRLDQQVKVRGFRIELEEIEAVLARHPEVAAAAVTVAEDRLCAFVVPLDGTRPTAEALRLHAAAALPEYMVPAELSLIDALPRASTGKLDRRALPAARRVGVASFLPPASRLERDLAEMWREVLAREEIGVEDNFFDLGGHSLLLARLQDRLEERLGRAVPIVDLFRFPTVRGLARFLEPAEADDPAREVSATAASPLPLPGPIAIIGMAGRFPGAGNLDAFWRNLAGGVESISRFGDDELLAAGESAATIRRPEYVRARAVLDDVDRFDAAFFGFSPREAETTNPQHRLFLECAWEALESAGYVPDRAPGRVGVFGGSSSNAYWLGLLRGEAAESLDGFQVTIGNDKDYLATRVSYKLNLRGPSVAVQTACSTSFAAVHMACRSLLAGECEMALAGGVTVNVPQRVGYLFQEGGIASPDGHCRAFDAAAAGTVSGEGVGIVVLKPLAAALADGDAIRAVILGSALNNDGAGKMGYTAPGVEGQELVIRAALASAGVAAGSIGYVEAHGTGTPLGDPVEVAALTRAFAGEREGEESVPAGSRALGSLKSNVGHMDAAAGIGGLIKTALALERRAIPPSLHFTRPNPQIDFAAAGFFVPTELRPWPRGAEPRRAGVSSFGIGGTNVHAILEEAPDVASPPSARPQLLLPLSAAGPAALAAQAARLAEHLEHHPEQALADVAYTLQVGRKVFGHRRAVVAVDRAGALAALADPRAGATPEALAEPAGADDRPVAFLFPGQGVQRPGMARDLYAAEAAFRAEIDRSCEVLAPRLGLDLKALLLAPAGALPPDSLDDTRIAQPALFAFELALARTWMSWGIAPRAMLGHSLGEWVAACLAEVFSFEDALALVAERGRLMSELPRGGMLAVPLAADEVEPLLGPDLALAAINGPEAVVASGPLAPLARLEKSLLARGVPARRLRTSHAFHSPMMEPILEVFAERVRQAAPQAPRLPLLSNRTGALLRGEEARDPLYWAGQLRAPVRFDAGLRELFREPSLLLLEIGPGRSLATLATRHPERAASQGVVSSGRSGGEAGAEAVTAALAELWVAGAKVDWRAYHAGERRLRVALPTYPFQRERYWVEPVLAAPAGAEDRFASARPAFAAAAARPEGVYLIAGALEEGAALAAELLARPGARLVLGPGQAEAALASRLRARGVEIAVAEGEGPAAAAAAARGRFGRIDGAAYAIADPGSTSAATLGEALGRVAADLEALAALDEGDLAEAAGASPSGAPIFRLLVTPASGSPGAAAVAAYADAFATARMPLSPWLAVPCPPPGPDEARRLALGRGLGLAPAPARAGRPAEPGAVPAARPAGRHSRPRLDTPFVAPRTEPERRLAAIWEELLGIEEVGVDDSFLALGGDSVVSLQMLSRARRAGFDLSPRQVFELQTIGELAVAASATVSEGGTVVGPVPLAPIQRWFFALDLAAPARWSQALMLAAPAGLDAAAFSGALLALLAHHDALRHRFVRGADGWRQEATAPGGRPPLFRVDLSALSPGPAAAARTAAAASAEGCFDLGSGPLFVALYFDSGPAVPGRLLLSAHHLVVDAFSWPPILEDLESAYTALARGEAPSLPPKTGSYRRYAERLAELARSSSSAAAALDSWSALVGRGECRLPRDFTAGENLEGSTATVEAALPEASLPSGLPMPLHEALLAAFGRALAVWAEAPGAWVDVESHGRDLPFDDVDPSRTVGWFTRIHPLLVPAGDGVEEALAAVRRGLRGMRDGGFGFDLLRLSDDPEIAARRATLPRPEASFLYLGQVDRGASALGLFRPTEDPVGAGRAPFERRPYLLEAKGAMVGGALRFEIAYSSRCHERATVERLARAVVADLLALLEAPSHGRPRAADFPLADLDEPALARLTAGRDVEDLYPLSDLQQGLLFHALEAPEAELYVQQTSCTLRGPLQAPLFERAWQRTVDRHPILRTSFVSGDLAAPLQRVERGVAPALARVDLRALRPEARRVESGRLVAVLRRGFALDRAPLLRLNLLHLDTLEHRFVWTLHHLMLDGWSVQIVQAEVLAWYVALAAGRLPELAPRKPFAAYIRWLAARDLSALENFWRGRLAGFRSATPLGARPAPAGQAASREVSFEVDRRLGEALGALGRGRQLTLGTLVHGAWALALADLSESDDVCFGTVVSGRAIPLDGIEEMIGVFINTLPVRVRIERSAPLVSWLADLQGELAELRRYEATPLAEAQRWSDVGRGGALFENILAFENFPVDLSLARFGEIEVEGVEHYIRESYPLVAEALLDRQGDGSTRLGCIQFRFDPARFDPAAIEAMARRLLHLLEEFVERIDETVAETLGRLADRARREREAAAREAADTDRSMLKKIRRRPIGSGKEV